jgi:uncharacterized coiled-coil protein SlyX
MLKLVGAIVAGVLLASLSVLVLTTPTHPEKKIDTNDLVKFVENQNKINATNLELHQRYGARLGELEAKIDCRDKTITDLAKVVKDLQDTVNRIINKVEKIIKDVNDNVMNDHEHRLDKRIVPGVPPVGVPGPVETLPFPKEK